MDRIQPILQKLGLSQAQFLRAADAIAGPQWLESPKAGCWSAGELTAHLGDIERSVLGYADRVVRKAPRSVPFYKRLHLPLALVEWRFVKRRVPAVVAPSTNLGDKESMLAELRGVRERTQAFLQETLHRDLSVYGWQHPFLGRLNFYEWFAFLAAHQVRHVKQMWEIAQNLPKDVATSQK